MKKKKKKSKNKKTAVSASSIYNELVSVIEAGRIRKAFELAKEILKKTDCIEEYYPSITRAYELRITNLFQKGHYKESEELISGLRNKRPEIAALFSINFQIEREIVTGKTEILNKYIKDPEISLIIDNFILYTLKNPGLFINNSDLSSTHPLKSESLMLKERRE